MASIIPELAEDAVSWKVTSASFIARQKGDPLSTLVIQVRRQGPPTTGSPPAPGPPLSEILAQTTLLETELPLVYGWVQVTFDMEQSLSPSEGVCITIGTNSGSDAAEVLYQNGGAAPTPSNQFWKGKSGDWSMSAGRDIPIELQGTVETP